MHNNSNTEVDFSDDSEPVAPTPKAPFSDAPTPKTPFTDAPTPKAPFTVATTPKPCVDE